MTNLKTSALTLTILLTVWGIAVGLGLEMLWQFQSTPGDALACQDQAWPSQAPFGLESQQLTLVMFVHPRCPCTVASVSELRRVTAGLGSMPRIHLAILQPLEPDDSWQSNELVQTGCKLPGAEIHWDHGGQIARLFGTNTSGQVLLFDPQGRSLYRGGVTDLRGQEGPSREGEALRRCLVTGRQAERDYPVFGCALQD